MRECGGKTYRPWEPERYRQDAQSPAAKLPEGDVVFFLLDTVPQLELRRFYSKYSVNPFRQGRQALSHHHCGASDQVMRSCKT